MPYDINTALERLEQNLQDLDSARIQVENTVNASNDLRHIVNEYVESITKLYADVQEWEKQLKKSQTSLSEQVQDAFIALKKSSETISESFKNSTDNTLSKFTEQNLILTERVNELGTLRQELKTAMSEIVVIKNILTTLTNVLTESQQGQDKALANIIGSVSELPVTVKGYTDDVMQQMDERHRAFNHKIDNIMVNIETVMQKQDELASSCANIQSSCNGLQSSCNNIDKSIVDFRGAMEEMHMRLSKSININRWIIVIGIIIIMVLDFLTK